jgi:hypothetical protein
MWCYLYFLLATTVITKEMTKEMTKETFTSIPTSISTAIPSSTAIYMMGASTNYQADLDRLHERDTTQTWRVMALFNCSEINESFYHFVVSYKQYSQVWTSRRIKKLLVEKGVAHVQLK